MSAQAETDLASEVPADLLVPGDTAGFTQVASTLRSHSRVLDEAASSLSRVDVTNWRGQASVGFRQVIDVEPRRWRTAADAFVAGAVAIEGFVASLVPARETARQARAKYQEYVRLVADATALTSSPLPGPSTPISGTMSTADRMRIGARADQMNTIAARGPDLGTIGALAVQEVFAADALRRQAIEMLTRARATIESAGNIAADALATAMEQAPAARRFDEATIRPAGATAAGHNTLDVVGNIPGLGEIADLTNAGWYLSEGHTLDAGISMAGTIPLGGMAAVAGRRLMKGSLEAVDDQAGTALRHLDDGGLTAHELDPVGHTISRHVGQTADDLRARINSSRRLNAVSTFASLADAERYTYAALATHGSEIATWIESGATVKLELRTAFDHPIGQTMYRSEPGSLRDASSVTTVLRPDPTMPNGYRIVTSYS